MKITIEIDNETAEAEINDVFLNQDISRYIGYWAADKKMRGECVVFECIEPIEGQPKTFTMTRRLAQKCLAELVRSKGANLEDTDSSDYDEAVQMAVFGEVVYG